MLWILTLSWLACGVGHAAENSLRFIAIGDWGGGDDKKPSTKGQQDVADGMAAAASRLGGIDFVMALGDNFYSDGISGDEHSSRFNDTFEDVYNHPELQCDWKIVAGNHDHYGNVTAQIEYSHESSRWKFPSLWYDFKETFIAPDGRNVTTQIVYIDTVVISGMSHEDPEINEYSAHPLQDLMGEQLEWLEDKLRSSNADYLWVSGHYPVYSHCMHGPNDAVIEKVLPLLQRYRVTGYIAGHDHCLAHYDEAGMKFVVSGAGKQNVYPPTHIFSRKNRGDLKFRMDLLKRHGAEAGFASFFATAEETLITYHDEKGNAIFSDTVAPRAGIKIV